LHQNILLRSPETLAPQPDTLDLQQNNSSQELANVDGQPANSSRFPKKGFRQPNKPAQYLERVVLMPITPDLHQDSSALPWEKLFCCKSKSAQAEPVNIFETGVRDF
jgi:hypothetical protein